MPVNAHERSPVGAQEASSELRSSELRSPERHASELRSSELRSSELRSCVRPPAEEPRASTDAFLQAAPEVPAFLLGGELEGRYRLLRRIGSGGMGHVFEAEDRDLGRHVAVKVLRERDRDQEIAKRRLAHEARSAACVQHPHIVRIYELGSSRGLDYVVMELLEGDDLQTRLRTSGPLAIELVEKLALALASALIAMHEAGVIHRDLKPGNLFLAREGSERDVLKVLDFGVAKGTAEVGRAITETGQVLGTLLYMAPEQLRGAKRADAQTDIWSAGAVLYEALTGHRPFEADCIADLVGKIVNGVPAPIEKARADVPPSLAAAVRTALHRDPAVRFASARALQAALLGPVVEQLTSAPTQPWRLAALGGALAPLPLPLPAQASPQPRADTTKHWGPVLAVVTLLLLLSAGIRWVVAAPVESKRTLVEPALRSRVQLPRAWPQR